MFGFLKSFFRASGGNTAVAFAVAAGPLLGAAGLAMDYAVMFDKKSKLQHAADAAALASARELALSATKRRDIRSVAKTHAMANLDVASSDLTVRAGIGADNRTMNVKLSLYWKPFFAQYFDKRVLPIEVKARALLLGKSASVCVLALDSSGARAISMDKRATLVAKGCSIFSNSVSGKGISVSGKSKMGAEEIMAAGGYRGPLSSYSPKPVTDSVAIPDPLSGRKQPKFSGCDHKNFTLSKGKVTLRPGVYCGGITLSGNAKARLKKGVYIIRDGLLDMGGNSTIKGNGVGFFLTGASAGFEFGASTQVVLSAPSSGPLAGILFFQDRGSGAGAGFKIASKDAEKFEGTIYLPGGTFEIKKASRVGQKSAWTAIIAHRILIGNGPNIEINADYGAMTQDDDDDDDDDNNNTKTSRSTSTISSASSSGTVPVPPGIILGARVRLIK